MVEIIVALIAAIASIVVLVLGKKLRDENSTQHAAVQQVIGEHSEKIGGLEVKVDYVAKEVADVKVDVGEIRDAVVPKRRIA